MMSSAHYFNRTRMKELSSDAICSNDDDKNLEWLLEVFGSKVTPDDMASAYYQARGDIHKANEILCNMLGSSSSNETHNLIDDLTSTHTSSVGTSMSTAPVINDADYPRLGVYEPPPKALYRHKTRNSGVSMGTVSSRIGADYGRSRPLTRESYEVSKPVKLMSNEVPASQIWVEKSKPENIKNETMSKDIEDFLLKMLGDGFQLDMEVIKQVVGGCGYDVKESMEKLMSMSTPTLDLGNAPSTMVDQTRKDLQDLEIKSEKKQQFTASSAKSNLEKEILEKLFNSGVEPETIPIHPKREPRARKYGVVTEPLEEPVFEFKNPIVEKQDNKNGNEETEDSYETLREAALEHWVTMKKYYRAAAEAYAKGDNELAEKFVKQGHFFMANAREANVKSGNMLTETRNDGEAISIDLDTYDPKEAIRLLKTQLKSVSGIPSIHYLKVKVGTSGDKTKRLICKLLEKDGITWSEEEGGHVMAIRIDVINPKRLSFNKK
ncbi:hypothetical protein LXL04_001986 [Taraxacum kok-saghyz]